MAQTRKAGPGGNVQTFHWGPTVAESHARKDCLLSEITTPSYREQVRTGKRGSRYRGVGSTAMLGRAMPAASDLRTTIRDHFGRKNIASNWRTQLGVRQTRTMRRRPSVAMGVNHSSPDISGNGAANTPNDQAAALSLSATISQYFMPDRILPLLFKIKS